jgi:hypothetical protein
MMGRKTIKRNKPKDLQKSIDVLEILSRLRESNDHLWFEAPKFEPAFW